MNYKRLKILNNYAIPILLIIAISVLNSIVNLSNNLETIKIFNENTRAVQLANDIYNGIPNAIYKTSANQIGELNLVIEKQEAFFVFRGTDFLNLKELFLNIDYRQVGLIYVYIFVLYLLYLSRKNIKIFWSIFFGTLLLYSICLIYGIFNYETKYLGSSEMLYNDLQKSILSFSPCDNCSDLKDWLVHKNVQNVYFSGHSKGGAEATLAYFKFQSDRKYFQKVELHTIGSTKAFSDSKNEDKNAFNLIFYTDTVQLLNSNEYLGQVIKVDFLKQYSLLVLVFLPMILFAYIYYLIGKKVSGSIQKVLKSLFILSFPFIIIFLGLIFSHSSSHYLTN